jgi:asparagine synthase (glutamine-hydrolysing)
MCGIAGIYNTSKSIDELYAIGKKMVKQLHHRGPDANGIKVCQISTKKNVMLAHTRLSVIDLSDAGSQPMATNDNSLWIVFNGEIYNYKELKVTLEKHGVEFRTDTDTEVILAAYRVWGLSCFERFIGMWAIALWDEKNDQLILSRDRLGIKPLYFYSKNGTWIFGSEPKVIVEQAPECRRLNMQAVSDYFSYRYVLGGDSFFKGVHSVEAGTHKIICGSEIKTVRYWDLPVETDKADISEKLAGQEIKKILESAVNYRMISDVPVGSFLSGGLDSSILVWEMARQHAQPIKTFTIGFQEEGYNEFKYADEVSRHCKTDHKEILLNTEEYLSSLQTMIRIKDAPLSVPNEIALHELSKLLKKDITVVLSGEGADELFGGYGRIFRSAYDYQRVQNYGVEKLPTELRDNLLKKYKNLEWSSEVEHFLSQYSYLDTNVKDKLFRKDVMSSLGDDPHNYNFFINKWSKLDGLDLHEKYMWIFQKVHLQGLLGRLDSATMSASVEGRVPFVDHRLIEYVNKLPLHCKMKWINEEKYKQAENLNSSQISEKYDITKYLLRKQYGSKLPSSIISRKKVGFPVPLSEWLSGPLLNYSKERLLASDARTREIFNRKTVIDILNNNSNDDNAGLHVWMMLNIEEWMQTYDVVV